MHPHQKNQIIKKKNNYFFQYFWKEQFDTFDNHGDVLRAAFCDSRNVFSLSVYDAHNIPLDSKMVWNGYLRLKIVFFKMPNLKDTIFLDFPDLPPSC